MIIILHQLRIAIIFLDYKFQMVSLGDKKYKQRRMKLVNPKRNSSAC